MLKVNNKKNLNVKEKIIKICFKHFFSECHEYSSAPHSKNCHHKVSPLLGYRPAEQREFPHTVMDFFIEENHCKCGENKKISLSLGIIGHRTK